jgi:hypothetical protein
VSSDPSFIAERLGVPAELVRRLQRRGYLRRFDLDPAEVRLRLWRGYLGRAGSWPSHQGIDAVRAAKLESSEDGLETAPSSCTTSGRHLTQG